MLTPEKVDSDSTVSGRYLKASLGFRIERALFASLRSDSESAACADRHLACLLP